MRTIHTINGHSRSTLSHTHTSTTKTTTTTTKWLIIMESISTGFEFLIKQQHKAMQCINIYVYIYNRAITKLRLWAKQNPIHICRLCTKQKNLSVGRSVGWLLCKCKTCFHSWQLERKILTAKLIRYDSKYFRFEYSKFYIQMFYRWNHQLCEAIFHISNDKTTSSGVWIISPLQIPIEQFHDCKKRKTMKKTIRLRVYV